MGLKMGWPKRDQNLDAGASEGSGLLDSFFWPGSMR